jgi:hypothetical protein
LWEKLKLIETIYVFSKYVTMRIKEIKKYQEQRLTDISIKNGVDFNSLKLLLESVRTKKLLKRNNFHQQKISDVIENAE